MFPASIIALGAIMLYYSRDDADEAVSLLVFLIGVIFMSANVTLRSFVNFIRELLFDIIPYSARVTVKTLRTAPRRTFIGILDFVAGLYATIFILISIKQIAGAALDALLIPFGVAAGFSETLLNVSIGVLHNEILEIPVFLLTLGLGVSYSYRFLRFCVRVMSDAEKSNERG